MQTTAEQARSWTGPAILSYGFRPFFLFGSLWAAFAMVLWVGALLGSWSIPSAFDPVSWHAHAFLFGYLSAIVAGFLLTAVPNWTGRMPIVGWKLGGLFALWAIGRIAVLFSAHLPLLLVALLDMMFLVALAGVILREIIAGKNWRNMIVLALLAALIIANALFHYTASNGSAPAHGAGLRLGLSAAIMMIAVIGGRIIPSFTRNWLVQSGSDIRPVPPMQKFDKITLLGSLLVLIAWVAAPYHPITGVALIAMGIAHSQRLRRWAGRHTRAEPLIWVLHLGYSFVPMGAFALGLAVLWPDVIAPTAAQHIWMAGAIGMMTLAVMTRATRGHTGQSLTANAGTTALYLMLFGSVVTRVAAGVAPGFASELYNLSGVLWIASFAGFAVLYGPFLLRPKPVK